MRRNHLHKGLTLVELLVVIAIISLIASVILASLSTGKRRAQVAKAKAELIQIALGLELLVDDTGRLPYGDTGKPIYTAGCVHSPDPYNEPEADSPAAGIAATDGNFPNWNGPYYRVPKDPWGNSYIFDEDYNCSVTPTPEGCERYTNARWPFGVRAVHSRGPNGSAPNAYDSDDIVRVICVH